MKKQLFSLVILSMLFGCSSKTNSNVVTSSESSSSNFETTNSLNSSSTKDSDDSSSFNNTTSSNPSSSDSSTLQSEKTSFLAPSNARIEGTTYIWDEVENASNGYKIRINNTYFKDVYTNSYDILSDETILVLGLNTFEVRVNATEDHYISSYTQISEYIFGADEASANEFVEMVSKIGDVSLSSYDDLNNAKLKYLSLSDIDKLLLSVKNSFATLNYKDGEYFKLLVHEVLNSQDDNVDLINNARNYYESILDKNVSSVIEALNISIASNVTYQIIHQSLQEATLFIYAYGENILGELLSQMAPVIKYNGSDLKLDGKDGIYYTSITNDVELYYSEEKIADIKYIPAQDGSTFGITDGLSFGATSTMDIDHFTIKVFKSDDIQIENNKIMLLANPLATFNTNSNPFKEKNIYNALAINGYKDTIEYRFMIEAVSSDGKVSLVTHESISEIRTITVGELKLSSPIELEPNFIPNIKENGDLDYRWEIINNNPEFLAGEVSYLELMMYDANVEFIGENTPAIAIIKLTQSGFIYEKDIINYLKKKNIYGSINLKMAMRFVPVEDSIYKASDYVILENSHIYEVSNQLSTYGNIYVDQNNGRLVWPWEIFMEETNPEANSVNYIKVFILSSDSDEFNENNALASFNIDYRNGDTFTNKEDIETILKNNNLPSGNYCFLIKLVAFEESALIDSSYYPLTESYYYTVEE